MSSTDYQPLKDEFESRYCRWRLTDAQREIEEGFPFLREMKGPRMRVILAILDQLSKERQHNVVRALIKNQTTRRVLDALGEPLIEAEVKLVDGFWGEWTRTLRKNEELRVLFSDPALSPYKYIPIKQLKPLIIEELKSVFEAKPKIYGADLDYEISMNSWSITTSIHVQRDLYSYYHQISLDNLSPRIVLGDYTINIASWLSFRGSDTWCFLTEEDVPRAAQTITVLCSRFLSLLPELLDGLNP